MQSPHLNSSHYGSHQSHCHTNPALDTSSRQIGITSHASHRVCRRLLGRSTASSRKWLAFLSRLDDVRFAKLNRNPSTGAPVGARLEDSPQQTWLKLRQSHRTTGMIHLSRRLFNALERTWPSWRIPPPRQLPPRAAPARFSVPLATRLTSYSGAWSDTQSTLRWARWLHSLRVQRSGRWLRAPRSWLRPRAYLAGRRWAFYGV